MNSQIRLCTVITHMENRIANNRKATLFAIEPSQTVCNVTCTYGNRSCTCLEVESKHNSFQIIKKERDNMEWIILFTRNGESHIEREKTCLRAQ